MGPSRKARTLSCDLIDGPYVMLIQLGLLMYNTLDVADVHPVLSTFLIGLVTIAQGLLHLSAHQFAT